MAYVLCDQRACRIGRAIYLAAVESVEEAVVNAMIADEDMSGDPYDRLLIKAIEQAELCRHLRAQGRLNSI